MKKTVKILVKEEVFKTFLTLFVGDDYKYLEKYFDSKDLDIFKISSGYFLTQNNHKENGILLHSFDILVLVHELYHFVYSICQDKLVDDEETFAYLMECYLKKILSSKKWKGKKHN